MREWLISDTHFNHDNIATYCHRPDGWHSKIIRMWQQLVAPEDVVIHLGDVLMGNTAHMDDLMAQLPGRKILVRGNHDKKSNMWYMRHGFDFSCDSMVYKRLWLTHRPSLILPLECDWNIHGHMHNNKPNHWITEKRILAESLQDYHRLFVLEWIAYKPAQIKNILKATFPTKKLAEGTLKDKRIQFVPKREEKTQQCSKS